MKIYSNNFLKFQKTKIVLLYSMYFGIAIAVIINCPEDCA